MDIEKWLCGLGLQQYVATFRDNAIDAEVLSELTEADLEKLGIVLGHRKRLLRAIGTLASPTGLEQAALVGLAPPIGDGAERRQLTVMFCDLVGSTALATMTTNHNSYAEPEVTLPAPSLFRAKALELLDQFAECHRLGDCRVPRLPGLLRQKDGVLSGRICSLLQSVQGVTEVRYLVGQGRLVGLAALGDEAVNRQHQVAASGPHGRRVSCHVHA